MNVDNTDLLVALKRERRQPQPAEVPEEEKVKAAEEIHEWLSEKGEPPEQPDFPGLEQG